MKRSTFLVLLFLVGFLLRLGVVIALRDVHSGPSKRHGADGVEFNQLAEHEARGDGYVNESGHATSFRAPGFPFFLAGIYTIFGRSYVAAYVALCLLGASSLILTYGLAREVLNEQGARLAGVLGAFYFPHIYFSTIFYSESLAVFCLSGGLWAFLRHLKSGTLTTLAIAGLLMGWTTLTRPFAILMLPILLAILVAHQLTVGRVRLASALVWVLSFLVVVAPWTIRNYSVFGRFVLVATNGGSTFYGGNNDRVLNEPRYYGAWIATTQLEHRDLIDAAPDEVSHDKMEWRLGQDWVKTHLSSLPKLFVFKFLRLWLPDMDSPNKSFRLIQYIGYTPFAILFLVGWSQCLRCRRYWSLSWLVLHCTLLATVAISLIFWGSPRFRDSNMPLLMVYAALGLQTLGLRKFLPKVGLSPSPEIVPVSVGRSLNLP